MRFFASVARNKSITLAANELNLTKAAISFQIKKLEDELGVSLFSRDSRSVSLTKDGYFVLEEITQILSYVDERYAHLKGSLERDNLLIQTYVMPSVKWLSSKLISYKSPVNTQVGIFAMNSEDYDPAISDVGFVLKKSNLCYDSTLDWVRVFPHEVTPICTPEFYLQYKAHIDSGDLTNVPIIATPYDSDEWTAWLALCNKNIQIKPKFIAGDKMIALELGLNHRGIVMVNSPFIRRELESNMLIKPYEESLYQGEWGFVYKKKSPMKNTILDLIGKIMNGSCDEPSFRT